MCVQSTQERLQGPHHACILFCIQDIHPFPAYNHPLACGFDSYTLKVCLLCMQLISGQYYSAQLRFFRQLCTAAKVDTVSKLAQKMLDEGKCVVIGLQSTGEPCARCFCLCMPCS